MNLGVRPYALTSSCQLSVGPITSPRRAPANDGARAKSRGNTIGGTCVPFPPLFSSRVIALTVLMVFLGGTIMCATDNNSPLNEPWRLPPSEREAIKKSGLSYVDAEKEIGKQESLRKTAWQYVVDSHRLGEKLHPIYQRLERLGDNDVEVSKAVSELKTFLTWLEGMGQEFPKEAGNDLSRRLISVYFLKKARSTYPLNAVVRMAVRYGDSPEVRKFTIELLTGPDKGLRDVALQSIAWNNRLLGDMAIYAAVQVLATQQGAPKHLALAVMSRLDRERTLPTILAEVDSESDVTRFIKLCDIISEYRRPDLLRPILRRVSKFPRSPFGTGKNPTTGIYPELLLSYIEKAEDDDLSIALDALDRTTIARAKSHSILLAKLDSPSGKSRTAVSRSLANAIKDGAFSNETLADIEENLNQRNSRSPMEEMRQVLEAIRQHRDRKGL